ncbi:hypothetical protein AUJ83_01905 [Candidatus Woesearchaeota archaeon CG1_02_33_12]|nr:MAG: hypothetical protein AUJ83_01905 [Candidatus Woesearchaeota archaeon CG1_02_33_12]
MVYFNRENYIKRDRQKLPNVFNKTQLIDLFDCIDNPQTMIGAGLGFFCGLRISEVIAVKTENVDIEKRQIKIENGKGGKDAYCIIPPPFVEPLRLWLKFIGNMPYIFPSRMNPKKHVRKSEMFRKYVLALKKAGLRKETGIVEFKNRFGTYQQPRYQYCFHTLRHSFATYLLEQGVDIAVVSKLMRHNQIDTTMIYTHISDKLKKKAIDDSFDPFKAYHFKKSEHQDRKEQLLEERERRFVTEMSNPIHILQMKLVNGEITEQEFKQRMDALKSTSYIIEVSQNAKL